MSHGHAGGHALLLYLREVRLHHRAALAVLDERVDPGIAFCGPRSDRMFSGDGTERGAHQRIGARGEHPEHFALAFELIREADAHAFGLADPVLLHPLHLLRPPRQVVERGEQLLGVMRDAQEVHRDLALLDQGAGAPAAALDHLLVREDRLVDRIPVDDAGLLIGKALLEEPGEDPLIPSVVLGLAGRELAFPVEREAEAPQLQLHVGDVVVGPLCRRYLVRHRRVFRRQPERIPAHRLQHVEAAHAVVPGENVADRIVPHVPHVQLSRGVGEHGQAIELPLRGVFFDVERASTFPERLSFAFDRLRIVGVLHAKRGIIGRTDRAFARSPRATKRKRWRISCGARSASRSPSFRDRAALALYNAGALSLHLEHLNPEQLAAVTLPDEHALILAGAGSGKTRVLTTRIAWLIKGGRTRPARLLAVTFTNKAAREMLTRITAMLPANPRGMWIGTFHGLCNRMLRAHHRDASLPAAFQILDSQDQLALVKRLAKSLNMDEERFAPRELSWFINANKEEGVRARDVSVTDENTRRMADFYAAYDEQCQREGVVDFPELLVRSYELLKRNEILREHYAQRFQHILVDEFQDTNRLQYRWLKLFGVSGARYFCVGDDDQSIYTFRGAHVGNMADFEREFKVGTVIRLEQNYRSHGNILDAANALIANNRNRLGKNLWTAAGKGEPVRVFEGESDSDEARWIVEEALALNRDGARFSSMAILYRSNAQSRVLEHSLFSRGIAYRVYGGLRFFERAEIKHALAYLRLVALPDDDNAFLRVVNYPPRGIGARTLEQLQDAAKAKQSSLYQAAEGKVVAFRQLIEALRAETQGLPLPELVEVVVAKSGLIEHYKTEREGADRIENLAELVNAASTFTEEDREVESGEAADPLTAFLTHAALEAGEHQAGEGQDALQMMSVHSAKGLEFDVVFLTGLEEGLFPHEQSVNERDGLEEERRLAYVAITRARHRLYLSHAQTRMLHGQTRYNIPSRFLEEIPQALMKWLTPRFSRQKAFQPDFSRQTRTMPVNKPLQRDVGGFRIGQNVVHAKFGTGIIIDAEGQGNDARVQVNFGHHGVKWLAVSVAKLQAA